MTDLDFKTIGLKIKERRQALGITQEVVANALEVNASHISNIERGRANPSLTALVKIANILRCSVDCFICEEYNFDVADGADNSIDTEIANKLKLCSDEKKYRIAKMIDLL